MGAEVSQALNLLGAQLIVCGTCVRAQGYEELDNICDGECTPQHFEGKSVIILGTGNAATETVPSFAFSCATKYSQTC